MVNLALGFFGFMRKFITPEAFESFQNIHPDCDIDIYISCPNKFNEYDENTIDEESFRENLQTIFKKCHIYINIYTYDPFIFIKRIKELALPDYTDVPTYRVLSQHFSIGELSKYITNTSQKNDIIYDNVILTRMDMFLSLKIDSQLLKNHNKDIIYIYRTVPYVSRTDAEDRVILSSLLGISKLTNLYYLNNVEKETIKNIYLEPYPERILCKFIEMFHDIRKAPQHGISTCLDINPGGCMKYTDKAKNLLSKLLKEYEESLL